MADAFLVVGFSLIVGGVALVSVPAACVVAGVILMLAGAAGYRRRP